MRVKDDVFDSFLSIEVDTKKKISFDDGELISVIHDVLTDNFVSENQYSYFTERILKSSYYHISSYEIDLVKMLFNQFRTNPGLRILYMSENNGSVSLAKCLARNYERIAKEYYDDRSTNIT